MLEESEPTRPMFTTSFDDALGAVRLTVSLPEAIAAQVRRQAGPGGMSAWVAQAVERQLRRQRLRAYLDELAETLGPLAEGAVARMMKDFQRILSANLEEGSADAAPEER